MDGYVYKNTLYIFTAKVIKMLADSVLKMLRSTCEYVTVGECVCPCRSLCLCKTLGITREREDNNAN